MVIRWGKKNYNLNQEQTRPSALGKLDPIGGPSLQKLEKNNINKQKVPESTMNYLICWPLLEKLPENTSKDQKVTTKYQKYQVIPTSIKKYQI